MKFGSHLDGRVDLKIPEGALEDRADLFNRIEFLLTEVRNSPAIWARDKASCQSRQSLAEKLYTCRRAIDECFDMSGFATSPAWDIMLDLIQNEDKGKSVSITSACIGAACASTTALRWLEVLISKSFIERIDDLEDKRRSYVKLTASGREATIKALKAHASI